MEALLEEKDIEEAKTPIEAARPQDGEADADLGKTEQPDEAAGNSRKDPTCTCPCECIEKMVATDGIWWRTYEEPDKPIEEYTSREIGVAGEFLAARYLATHGYEILAQNWRTRFGEADIICRYEDGTIVLVEVKTRLVLAKDRGAMPELAVDSKKQAQYRKLGLVYLMQHPDVDSLRFDVMAINFIDRHSARLRHLVGAFDCDF